MKRTSCVLLAIVASAVSALILTGCSSGSLPKPTEKGSGFLPDYSLLSPVANPPKDTEIYTYHNPDIVPGGYRSVLVDPVVIYQGAVRKGVTTAQVEAARDTIQASIANIAQQQRPLATQAGPGVARVTVAITGAVIDGQSFKVYNVIPVSAAIYAASKATNMDSKTPAMMVEVKVTDSVSGQLLRETVSVIKGDSFRMQSNDSTEFAQLAQNWVQQAFQYAVAHAAQASS